MSEQTARGSRAGMGVGTLVVSCVFAVVVGVVAGVITTFTHPVVPPWGLIAGLAIVAALVLGFRLVFDSRIVGAAAAVGFVVGTVALTLPASGPAIFALDGVSGWIWAIGPSLLALAALVQPWPGRASDRP